MPKLGAYDFDGTAFLTNQDSPNGMNVLIAYEKAIETVFGSEALAEYREQGGLMNGDPNDVINGLWPLACRESMLTKAFSYYQRRKKEIDAAVGQLDWGHHFSAAVELLVFQKLALLVPEIGTRFPDGDLWPRPLPGFLGHWRSVSGNDEVVTAILSSGHDIFIQRTFEVHGLKQPDFMTTNDTFRKMKNPISKPNVACLNLAEFEANVLCGGVEAVAYFGDDPMKDGEMAKAAGWPFYLADPDRKHPDHPERFVHWSEVTWPATV